MAVESVKQNSVAMVMQQQQQQQTNQTQMRRQSQEAPQNDNMPNDRVTLSSRQNETQGAGNQQQNRNPALSVPGQSQRPVGANRDSNANSNSNNLVAQLITEAANRTANMQQANNAYNPNKPSQTQNQINYTA